MSRAAGELSSLAALASPQEGEEMTETAGHGGLSLLSAPARRAQRDREATEAELLAAALRLLERHGVLAGLNLREVAEEAKVNRGLIYQYFGSRRALLRAALAAMSWQREEVFHVGRSLPFRERRRQVFRAALANPTQFKVEALLALDGDEELRLFPMLEETRRDLARDKAQGALPPDADEIVMHVMTAATYLGYCIFRDNLAREAGISPEELDRRAEKVFGQMVDGLCGEIAEDSAHRAMAPQGQAKKKKTAKLRAAPEQPSRNS